MTSEGVLLARPPLGGTLTPCPFECFHMRLLCVSAAGEVVERPA